MRLYEVKVTRFVALSDAADPSNAVIALRNILHSRVVFDSICCDEIVRMEDLDYENYGKVPLKSSLTCKEILNRGNVSEQAAAALKLMGYELDNNFVQDLTEALEGLDENDI